MKKILALLSSTLFFSLYSTIVSATDASYAYITNANNNKVTICTDAGVDGLDDCADSGVGAAFDKPAAIAIPDVTFGGNNYAYVANIDNNIVLKCEINSSTGLFTGSCTDSGAGAIFSEPHGIAFQTAEDETLYAYVLNGDLSSVTQCTVNASTGAFGTCVDGLPALSTPIGITIQTIAGIDYAYIPNSEWGSVSQCTVNATTGTLQGCPDGGGDAEFSSPQNIQFYTVDSTLYAYVTDSTHDTTGAVWQCAVDSMSGQLSDSCTSTGSGFDDPTGIAFETVDSVNYAYVTNKANNKYTQCTVNGSTGALESCTSSTIPNVMLDPIGLATYQVGSTQYIYSANYDMGTVSQCHADDYSGDLYCGDSGAGQLFTNPVSITFFPASGYEFAYIADPGASAVFLCTVSTTTGQFSNCSEQVPDTFSTPAAVSAGAIYSSGTAAFLYVSDQTTGTIWKCDISLAGGTLGQLSDCEDAGGGDYSFIVPAGLSFQVFGDLDNDYYLYIVNGVTPTGSVKKCTLAGDGTFSSCVDSGAGYAMAWPNSILIVRGLETSYAIVPDVAELGGDEWIRIFTIDNSTGDLTLSEILPTGVDGQAGITFALGITFSSIFLTDEANGISQCYFSEGDLGTCYPALLEPEDPINIAFQTVDDYTAAYIVQNNMSIEGCAVNSDGSLTPCVDAGAGLIFPSPTDIVFQEVGGTTYAYVTDSELNTVTQCILNTINGLLGPCVDSSAGDIFGAATGISFDTIETSLADTKEACSDQDPDTIGKMSSTLYAYVVDSSSNTVTQCIVDSFVGLFISDSCVSTGTVLSSPLGVGINNSLIYFTNAGTNSIMICEQGDDGLLGSCVDSGADPAAFSEPAGITFATDEEDNVKAYITNADNSACSTPNNSVTFCSVDSETGLLSGCTDSGVGPTFEEPLGIAFGSSYAYMANANLGENQVSRCSLNSNGSFAACGDSGAGRSYFSQPFGITFFTP